MREYKFRVWDNVDYMSTPFTFQDLQLKKVQFTSDCKVMQYTGLRDKNKIDIYEGDINQDGGKLIWNESDASFCWEYVNVETMPMDGESEWCEIVGNQYENPELLNTKQ